MKDIYRNNKAASHIDINAFCIKEEVKEAAAEVISNIYDDINNLSIHESDHPGDLLRVYSERYEKYFINSQDASQNPEELTKQLNDIMIYSNAIKKTRL